MGSYKRNIELNKKEVTQMKRKKMMTLFRIDVLLFAISGIVPLLAPFSVNKNGDLTIVGYVSGIMFWLGLLSGIGVYIYLSRRCDEQLKNVKKSLLNNKYGKIQFMSNQQAKIADLMLLIGTIGTIICYIWIQIPQFIAAIMLLLLLMGIYGHFLFNGLVFLALQKGVQKKTEKRMRGNNHEKK